MGPPFPLFMMPDSSAVRILFPMIRSPLCCHDEGIWDNPAREAVSAPYRSLLFHSARSRRDSYHSKAFLPCSSLSLLCSRKCQAFFRRVPSEGIFSWVDSLCTLRSNYCHSLSCSRRNCFPIRHNSQAAVLKSSSSYLSPYDMFMLSYAYRKSKVHGHFSPAPCTFLSFTRTETYT